MSRSGDAPTGRTLALSNATAPDATVTAVRPLRLRPGRRPPAAARPRGWSAQSGRAFTSLSASYGVVVLLWHALRLTPVAHWWLFELLDIFGLLLFTPLLPLLLLALVFGNRTAGLWLLAPLCPLTVEYGELLLPRSTPAEGRPLRVLTANLLVTNRERARVAAMLRAEQPDIVALQELGPGMAEYLARELRAEYPYQLLAPRESPFGLGILSRYPIQAQPAADERDCFCQRVTIDVDGEELVLINVHPPPPDVRLGQLGGLPLPTRFDNRRTNLPLDAALHGIDLSHSPTLVMGDFNVSDRQPMYRQLRRDLRDAHRDAGWGLGNSFPARSFAGFPELGIIRIDYILHNPRVAARETRTGATPGSDHHHVVADLLQP